MKSSELSCCRIRNVHWSSDHDTESAHTNIWIVPAISASPGQLDQQAVAQNSQPHDQTLGQQAAQLAELAEDLQQRGRLQESLQAFSKSLRADSDRAITHCNLGNLWQQLDDQSQAMACYQRALELDSELTTARQNLGYLLFNHGRTDEAVNQYNMLLSVDPSPITGCWPRASCRLFMTRSKTSSSGASV